MCTLAVTGPRPDKLWNDYDLVKPQTVAIGHDIARILQEQYCTSAICGGALGIDTLFALKTIELNISLTVAVPFRGQEMRWPEKAQDKYNYILSKAKEVVYVNELNAALIEDKSYISRLYMERNIWMVQKLHGPEDKLLAVWDGRTHGGTRQCYKYAKNYLGERRIIRLRPDDYVKDYKLF